MQKKKNEGDCVGLTAGDGSAVEEATKEESYAQSAWREAQAGLLLDLVLGQRGLWGNPVATAVEDGSRAARRGRARLVLLLVLPWGFFGEAAIVEKEED